MLKASTASTRVFAIDPAMFNLQARAWEDYVIAPGMPEGLGKPVG